MSISLRCLIFIRQEEEKDPAKKTQKVQLELGGECVIQKPNEESVSGRKK